MSDFLFNFPPELKKALDEFVGICRIHQQRMSQLAKIMGKVFDSHQKRMEVLADKMIELGKQYRTAIQEGITNFDRPQDYLSSNVTIHPWTRRFSINTGIYMINDIKDSHFDYLSDRYKEGFEAYLGKDFQKAIFTFLSCLDGIMKEFCEQHKSIDCSYGGQYPSHDRSRKHFMCHYKMEFAADNVQFQDRLKAFFDHRNQIMHGDRYAYFDENIATISLLFLGLIFYTVKNDI